MSGYLVAAVGTSLQYLSDQGIVLAGGTVSTFTAGTTTPVQTYTDSTLGVSNGTVITLTSAGRLPASCWVASGVSIKMVLKDSLGNTIANGTIDNLQGINDPAFLNVYPQTAAEIAAGVTPTNYIYPPGWLPRYATNLIPGTTDMSTALINALASNSFVYCPGAGPFYFAQLAPFNMTTGQTLYGDGAVTVLKFASFGTNNIQMSGIVGATVRDIALQVTGNGANTYTGVVSIAGTSSYCKVERVSISGVCGCGVLLNGPVSNNTVRNCNFTAFNLANSNDATADIYLTASGATGPSYNVIEGNQCFGGNYYGIILLTGGAGQQKNNVIANNRIGQHLAYGIVDYTNTTGDCFTEIIGNYIENIQGSVISGGQSGAGIYLAGAGGDVVAGNTIRNCCVVTTGTTLVPAGIGYNGSTSVAMSPCSITGNVISGMTQYYGIWVKTSTVGAVNITGNSVDMPASNTTGSAIGATNASNISITGNTINSHNSNDAILLNASSQNLSSFVVANNLITHTAGASVKFIFSAAWTFTQVTVSSNQCTTPGTNYNLLLQNLVQATVTGNVCSTTGSIPLQLTACTQTRVSNNVLINTGTNAFATSGTCTGSLLDESNYLSGSAGVGLAAVLNGGTGCNVRQLGTADPGGGTQVLGDMWYNTTGSAVLFAKVCTTAGTPGTFTGVTMP